MNIDSITKLAPIFNSFGIDLNNMNHSQIMRLENIIGRVKSSEDVTQEVVNEFKNVLGIVPPESPNENVSKPNDTKTPKVKVGRNENCPCESGVKFKKCCGKGTK